MVVPQEGNFSTQWELQVCQVPNGYPPSLVTLHTFENIRNGWDLDIEEVDPQPGDKERDSMKKWGLMQWCPCLPIDAGAKDSIKVQYLTGPVVSVQALHDARFLSSQCFLFALTPRNNS